MHRLAHAMAFGAVLGLAPVPVAAQLMGMPVYSNPKGGRGVTVSGEFARGLNEDSGKQSSFAARATLGLSAFSVGAGVGTYDTGSETELQYAGHAALRVIGGALFPASVALQAGFAQVRTGGVGGGGDVTMRHLPFAVGIGLNVPAAAFLLEPWVAPRYAVRWIDAGSETVTQRGVGVSAGVNLGFANGLALHAAADWADLGADEVPPALAAAYPDITPLTLGVGLAYTFRLPTPGIPGPGPMNR